MIEAGPSESKLATPATVRDVGHPIYRVCRANHSTVWTGRSPYNISYCKGFKGTPLEQRKRQVTGLIDCHILRHPRKPTVIKKIPRGGANIRL